MTDNVVDISRKLPRPNIARLEQDCFWPYPVHPALDKERLYDRSEALNWRTSEGVKKAIEDFNSFEAVEFGNCPPAFPEEVFSSPIWNVLEILEWDELKVGSFIR